ncbi:antitoxin [Devosia sp.]|uniref:type II toxin-antitoxin system RelB family antitoxin n=1 Tax=Devosia sp. TaxID=1871048 RepID=UPI00326472F8
MTTKLDPIISEFDTQEDADAYDVWFRAKVQASLDDPRPGIPHDQVMAELDAIIEAAAKRKKSA